MRWIRVKFEYHFSISIIIAEPFSDILGFFQLPSSCTSCVFGMISLIDLEAVSFVSVFNIFSITIIIACWLLVMANLSTHCGSNPGVQLFSSFLWVHLTICGSEDAQCTSSCSNKCIGRIGGGNAQAVPHGQLQEGYCWDGMGGWGVTELGLALPPPGLHWICQTNFSTSKIFSHDAGETRSSKTN